MLAIGLTYFGRLLPSSSAGLVSAHPHTDIACQDCHKFASGDSASEFAILDSRVCRECHGQNLSFGSDFHSETTAVDCAGCHLFHHPELIVIRQDSMSMEFAGTAKGVCRDCHADGQLRPEISFDHQVAARQVHSQRTTKFAESPSEFCLSCHDADRNSPGIAGALRQAPRFHVSASHVYGQELIPGFRRSGSRFGIQDEISPSLNIINDRIECQTCHSMISKNDYLLSRTVEDGLCDSCHETKRDLQPQSVFTLKSQ